MAEERRTSFEINAEFQKKKDAINAAKEASDLKLKASGKKGEEAKAERQADLKAELNMDEHRIDLEELYSRCDLKDAKKGLTNDQAAQKLKTDGPNRMTPPPTTPEWKKFLKELTGFFSLLLWFGSALCFFGYYLKKELDNLYLGSVLAIVVFATGVFSYLQERKGSALMESFKSLMPEETVVVRSGEPSTVNAIELVKGDIVRLKGGDKVPADIRIIECSDDLQVDNASLTGESEAQKRSTKFTDENPLETANLAFFGTQVPKGTCTGIIISTGDFTVMGRIAKLTTSTEGELTPIAKEINHFIAIVSGVAMFLGLSFGAIGIALGTDPITNLVFMIGIIVANVPEGLLATVTVCLTLTANRMASKQVLVKNLEGVETLGSTTCICSDKTGTLTQNVMTVAAATYDLNNYQCECTMYKEATLDTKSATFDKLRRIAALCNNARWDSRSQKDKKGNPIEFMGEKIMGDGSTMKVVNWKPIGDASESALLKFAQVHLEDIQGYRESYEKIKEIPFNSANKYQVSVHKQPKNEDGTDKPHLLVMKGAPERITSRCATILIDGEEVEFNEERQAKVARLQLELSRNGLRVLGFCEKVLDPEVFNDDFVYNSENPNFPLGESWEDPSALADRDPPAEPHVSDPLCFVGLFALIDPPRVQVPGAVEKCKTSGIRVIMVTGDHPETAKAIAKQVGIIWGDNEDDIKYRNEDKGLSEGDAGWEDPAFAPAIVVPGWDINQETPPEVWDDILSHNQVVFARTSPQQKLIIVENCQRRAEIVAVTGDGVNDAPALRKADIGVAMGIMGSAVSKEAADMILLDDNFASIVQGVEEGRLIFDNLKKSIAYTLSSNIPEIAPFLIFILLKVPLPLSTVLILLIDLGTDMVPAISMAWEKAESDIMKRPPRDSSVDRLVTRKLIFFAYLQIGVIQAAAGFFTWMVVMADYGFPPQMLIGQGAFENWGKHVLYCTLGESIPSDAFLNAAGQTFVKDAGDVSYLEQAMTSGYFFLDTDKYTITECTFPARAMLNDGIASSYTLADPSSYEGLTGGKVVPTEGSIMALVNNDYFPYMPYKARTSPFFKTAWLEAAVNDGNFPGLGGRDSDFTVQMSYQPIGVWGVGVDDATADRTGKVDGVLANYYAEKVYDHRNCFDDMTLTLDTSVEDSTKWSFPALTQVDNDGVVRLNIASRMMQAEALSHGQCSYFVSIVVVQWADLIICKTRMNSLYHQGMSNPLMNFGLLFETILACFFCYWESNFTGALGVRPLRLVHWFPAVPFSCMIVSYDEIRKYMMRKTTIVTIDKGTKQVFRDPKWLERNSYY